MGYVEELLERSMKLIEKCKSPGFKPTLKDVCEKITILQELEVLDDMMKAKMNAEGAREHE